MAIINDWKSSKEYDNKLSKIEHYSEGHHPEMMPFIGSHYNEARVLLIGESHYCSERISDAEKNYILNNWYEEPTPDKFTNKEYFNTRFVLHNFLSLKRSRAHSMFRNPAKSIIEALELSNVSDSEAFNICAFMNYFQRPELVTGGSINNNEKDNKLSYETFTSVCNVIKPELVLFLSENAFKAFNKYETQSNKLNGRFVKSYSHPTCAHWYSRNGKEAFESTIKKYVNFKRFSESATFDTKTINEKKPNNFNYIKKGQNRFLNNTITLKTYGSENNISEIVVHTKNKGQRIGVGYVVHHSFIWIWDYDKKEYIEIEKIDDFAGLREMYTEFIKFIKEL